jgi:TfoX/Sxy family transcriptional regulator of competence genes
MTMTALHHEVHAACPPERVWAFLSDLEAVQHYNPGVRRAVIEGTQRKGVGARRACELMPKGRVVERVTHWDENRAVGLEVAESDWPIHFMRWVTYVEPSGGGTRIWQSLEYEVKFGPFGWLLDRLVMRSKLTRALDEVFASLAPRRRRTLAYDEALAARVRQALGARPSVREKKMFGGIAFLIDDAMCIGVDKSDLIVRCDKAETDALLALPGVRVFDLSGGRPMKGWLLVGPEATKTASGFKRWFDRAVAWSTKAPATRRKPRPRAK